VRKLVPLDRQRYPAAATMPWQSLLSSSTQENTANFYLLVVSASRIFAHQNEALLLC